MDYCILRVKGGGLLLRQDHKMPYACLARGDLVEHLVGCFAMMILRYLFRLRPGSSSLLNAEGHAPPNRYCFYFISCFFTYNGELSEIPAGWHACMPRPTGFALERFVRPRESARGRTNRASAYAQLAVRSRAARPNDKLRGAAAFCRVPLERLVRHFAFQI